MVWCTYCGQEFSRAEHLDRHVITHTIVKPYKCSTCHFSFNRRDLLQRHYILVHKNIEDLSSTFVSTSMQRRPIACVACARAKTKCDKAIPSCSRCSSKGIVCQARSTRRTNDVAYRQARRTLSFCRNRSDSDRSSSSADSTPGSISVPRSRTTPVPIRPNLGTLNAQTATLDSLLLSGDSHCEGSMKCSAYSGASTPCFATPFPSPGAIPAAMYSAPTSEPSFYLPSPNTEPAAVFSETSSPLPYPFLDFPIPECSAGQLDTPYPLASCFPGAKELSLNPFDESGNAYGMQNHNADAFFNRESLGDGHSGDASGVSLQAYTTPESTNGYDEQDDMMKMMQWRL